MRASTSSCTTPGGTATAADSSARTGSTRSTIRPRDLVSGGPEGRADRKDRVAGIIHGCGGGDPGGSTRSHACASVLAESGFATLRTVYDEYQKRIIKVPWHYLRNIVIKRSEHIAHFKASAVSPLEAVRNVKVPIFFMHGTADNLIKPPIRNASSRTRTSRRNSGSSRGHAQQHGGDRGGGVLQEDRGVL